ncbi:Inorganic phosphate transporter pho84 [Ceratobasidium sp. 414]|nr:Inorganic phosphate transporter pho84 [Ceratobasidium sp. 414]
MSANFEEQRACSPGSSAHEIPVLGRERANVAGRAYNEHRRAALRRIDQADFSRFHVKACLVAGIGFFTSAYDIFAINIAAEMIGYVYNKDHALSPNQDLGLKVATPIGTLVGQLLFGWLADVVGRKAMYGVELTTIIVGTFAQAISGPGPTVGIIGTLIVWRFIMGIGIGGDYPLSAVITSEFAATRIRGRMMTAVFSMQGFGTFAAALVALIVTEAFKSRVLNGDASAVDYCWRLLIGLGAVPGVFALYFRLTIPETPRFTMDIERNVRQAAQDVDTFLTTGTYNVDPDAIVERVRAPKASWPDFCRHFGQWRNGKVLFGAAYSWFALDVAFYGLGLNNTKVFSAIGFGGSTNVVGERTIYERLHNASVGNLIISAGGLIPGYVATFFFIDRWGRKPIQLMGFTFLTGGLMVDEAIGAFVFLYCLANFFHNFGPNTTTFIVPGEAFPTRYRSTAHGISAASGKLGAIIAQVTFNKLKDVGCTPGTPGTGYAPGTHCVPGTEGAFIKHILEIFALFMLTGAASTLLIDETNGRSLEDLSNESQDGFISGGAGPLELHYDPIANLRIQMAEVGQQPAPHA